MLRTRCLLLWPLKMCDLSQFSPNRRIEDYNKDFNCEFWQRFCVSTKQITYSREKAKKGGSL